MLRAYSFLKILCLILAVGFVSYAAAGTAFSGSYKLGAANVSGSSVQLSISFTVVNHTAAKISNASLDLRDPRGPAASYGNISGVSLAPGSSTQVSGSFTVPKSIYDSWKKGSHPGVSITYNDANGNAVKAFIKF